MGLGQAADTRVELDSTALVGLFDLRYSHLFRLKESPCMEEARGIRRQKAQPLCAWHCSDTPCPSPSPCNLRWGDLRRMSQTGVSLDQEAWSVESRAKAGDAAEVREVFESAVRWQGTPQGVLLLPFKCPFPHVFLYRNAVCLVRVLLAVAPEARGGGPCSVGCFLTLFLPLFQEKLF